MSDDAKKATEGTGEEATNGAAKATIAADGTDTLKQIGGSRSESSPHTRSAKVALARAVSISW
jgi:hypothetical protein